MSSLIHITTSKLFLCFHYQNSNSFQALVTTFVPPCYLLFLASTTPMLIIHPIPWPYNPLSAQYPQSFLCFSISIFGLLPKYLKHPSCLWTVFSLHNSQSSLCLSCHVSLLVTTLCWVPPHLV